MISVFAALFVAMSMLGEAHGQSTTSKPVQVIEPFAAGGSADIIGRLLAEGLQERLGRPFLVVNREGAAGTLGAKFVAQAAPDGAVLGFGPSGPMSSQPHLRATGYGVGDFDYVCQVFENALALSVAKTSSFRTIKSLLDYARANPGKLNFGHPGIGTIPHLMGLDLKSSLGLTYQDIPYQGDGQTVVGILQGTVDFGITAVQSVFANDNVRVLAALTNNRIPKLPDVPTGREFGIELVLLTPAGLFAPKGLPLSTQSEFERACADVVSTGKMQETVAKIGVGETKFHSGADFAKNVQRESERLGEIIRKYNVKP